MSAPSKPQEAAMLRLPAVLLSALAASALLVAQPASAKPKHCPPGLAKKAVPCVPQGQAKKQKDYEREEEKEQVHIWHTGDRVRGDYVLIPRDEWERLRLRDYDDGSTYLRVDNEILRVARDTRTVIEAIRILDGLLD
jgi:Ni/Co efflux regulator RcnB